MSVKMRRRRRQARLKRVVRERRELGEFFAHGTFPSSARSCAVCPCGARAFSRDTHDSFVEEFWDAHAYCEVDG